MNDAPNHVPRLKSIKRLILETALKMNVGHIPSSLSCVEILYTLYNMITNITVNNSGVQERDRVILSKEHARLGQVCVLAECGLISREYLDSFLSDGGVLGHDLYGIVSEHEIQAIDVSCGSLGHGLSVGIGFALGVKNNVYVILGDGECQEGSVWEGFMFAAHNRYRLKNLTIVIDKNDVQIDNFVKDTINVNVIECCKIFGFDVNECDGHDILSLQKAFRKKSDKTKCIIDHTVKGKGLEFWIEKEGFSYTHAQIMQPQYAVRALESF